MPARDRSQDNAWSGALALQAMRPALELQARKSTFPTCAQQLVCEPAVAAGRALLTPKERRTNTRITSHAEAEFSLQPGEFGGQPQHLKFKPERQTLELF